MLLPTTLAMAAAAAVINFWLALRCGQVRTKEKINIGTGGSELMERRMRAHANFVENTPWVLALVGALELAGKGGQWLAYVAAVFMLGRVLHGLGMDGVGPFKVGRMIGTLTAMLTQIGLAIYAVLLLTGMVGSPIAAPTNASEAAIELPTGSTPAAESDLLPPRPVGDQIGKKRIGG